MSRKRIMDLATDLSQMIKKIPMKYYEYSELLVNIDLIYAHAESWETENDK